MKNSIWHVKKKWKLSITPPPTPPKHISTDKMNSQILWINVNILSFRGLKGLEIFNFYNKLTLLWFYHFLLNTILKKMLKSPSKKLNVHKKKYWHLLKKQWKWNAFTSLGFCPSKNIPDIIISHNFKWYLYNEYELLLH